MNPYLCSSEGQNFQETQLGCSSHIQLSGCRKCGWYLEEDAANATQQLWLLLRVVLGNCAVSVYSEHIVLWQETKSMP